MFRIVKNILLILLLNIYAYPLCAQDFVPPGDPIVIQIIELEYANAEELAKTLEPLLSPQGRITAYGPSNSLIIKDRKSIVEALVKIIKGPLKHK
jgi:type II secretory pathway component GspD/PulD (secretin)